MAKANRDHLLRFGEGKDNVKLAKLAKRIRKRIITFSLLAGHSCPWARDCKAYVVETPKGLRLRDGKQQQYRCYAASMEVRRPVIYNAHKHNFELAQAAARRSPKAVKDLILTSLPQSVVATSGKGIVFRQHVAGDYFNITYMRGWGLAAEVLHEAVFYGHTKSVRLLCTCLKQGLLPLNMRWSISHQRRYNEQLTNLRDVAYHRGVRSALCHVVDSATAAARLFLPVDEDDWYAYDCKQDYALVVHGTQPAKK